MKTNKAFTTLCCCCCCYDSFSSSIFVFSRLLFFRFLIIILHFSSTILSSTFSRAGQFPTTSSQWRIFVDKNGFSLMSTSFRQRNFVSTGKTSDLKFSSEFPRTFSLASRLNSCSGSRLTIRLCEVSKVWRDVKPWHVRGSKTRCSPGFKFWRSMCNSETGNKINFDADVFWPFSLPWRPGSKLNPSTTVILFLERYSFFSLERCASPEIFSILFLCR